MNFKNLFGIDKKNIKPICILAPFIYKGLIKNLDLNKLSKGRRFSTSNTDTFTLVHTHIGALNVGDAVLYLKDTPCQTIILYGACGLTSPHKTLDIGSPVLIKKAYNYESFSNILTKKNHTIDSYDADTKLLHSINITKVHCASFGSLKLEENYIEKLISKKIETVDMECSAFYSASHHTKKSAIALLFVTDIIKNKPLFESSNHLELPDSNVIKLLKNIVKSIK